MKAIKIVTILLIIVVIIISVVLIIISKNKKEEEIFAGIDVPDHGKEAYQGVVKPVTESNDFYIVENCINKYISYAHLNIEKGYDEETGEPSLAVIYEIDEETEKKQAIYDLLDKDFISENNITSDNIYNYIEYSNKDLGFEAVKMNKLEDAVDDVEGFSVYGKIRDIENGRFAYQYFVVKIDTNKNTFCIYPLKNSEYKDINDIKVKNNTVAINKNKRNTFFNINITEGEMARKYFQNYKNLMLEEPESAYEVLDKEYRQKRFGGVEGYKEYIQNNLEELRGRNILGYVANEDEVYREYICKDQYDNAYIFKATAIMQYSLIADTYTLDLPEFLEKYNSTSAQGKVALNMQKFVSSINDGDYQYAYSKLSEGFIKNYFPTVQSFERYIKDTLYSKNKVEYIKYSEESGLYTYDIRFVNAENEADEGVERTIIMQLKEGTDFVLSFNID